MESNWWQRLRFLSLVLLPKKHFSRICGWIADQRWPSYLLHQTLVRSFVRYFNVDLSECPQKLEDFQTFNEFFTRPLKPEARQTNRHPARMWRRRQRPALPHIVAARSQSKRSDGTVFEAWHHGCVQPTELELLGLLRARGTFTSDRGTD